MKTHEMPVIELEGSAYQRGYVLGKATRALVADLIVGWQLDLGSFAQDGRSNTESSPENYLTKFLAETQYVNSIKEWTPHLYEEVKGIADGAKQPLSFILAINFMDEEWIFGLRNALDRPKEKCTAFAIPGQKDSTGFAGQNMDIGSWSNGRQLLLRLMPTDVTYFGRRYLAPEALVFTNAGNIALNGVNANGLGITCNTLPQLNYSITGLPVSFVVRSVLEQSNLDDAERFLRSIEHASGQNYILSSRQEARCFECCGTSVKRYQPCEYQGRIFHTNHPLANSDINVIASLSSHRTKNSEARLRSIANRLGNQCQSPEIDNIKAALSSHDDPENPVSRNANSDGNAIGFTAGSSIYEYGAVTKLHLAAGPPCETEYSCFEFNAS